MSYDVSKGLSNRYKVPCGVKYRKEHIDTSRDSATIINGFQKCVTPSFDVVKQASAKQAKDRHCETERGTRQNWFKLKNAVV